MNSTRFLKSLLTMAMFAFVGCETDPTNGGTQGGGNLGGGDEPYTIVVNPPALFQVDGAVDDTQGELPVAWDTDSKISVYKNNGDWIDDFEVSDLDNLKFSAVDEKTDLSVGVKYIAVYPARQNEEATYADYVAAFDLSTQLQVGASLDHLLDDIQLSGIFYGGDDITFEHNTAILKLSFAEVADETPESVKFAYDTYSYTLSLSDMLSEEGFYTAYMMIDERAQDSAECVETFTVDYSGDDNDIVSIANSSVDYLKGYIYSLTIESKDEVPYSVIANAPTAYSNGVAAEWSENTVFSVYEKNGAWVDNFKVSDFENAEFVSANTATEFSADVDYIAVYPARTSTDEATYADYIKKNLAAQTQADATPTHLNALCQASSEFKGGEAINFAYESAILEVKFAVTADGTPQTMTVNDGATDYVLTIGSAPVGDFMAYVMVAPIAESTTVTYTVDYGGDDNTSSDEFTLSKDYIAGGVYAQTINVAPAVDDEPYLLTATLPAAYDNSFAWISAWSAADSFDVYKKSNGDKVDTFAYNATSGKFESSSNATELSADVDYVVTYAAGESIDLAAQTQTSTSMEHLKTTSQMSAEFKAGESVTFAYDYAVLEITFPSINVPKTLTLTNETTSKSYALTFADMTSADSYTAYLMVDPMAAESKLSYIIDCGTTTVSTYSTTLTAAYESGKSYIQNITTEDISSVTAISTAADLVTFLATPTTDAVLMKNITINGETITPSTSFFAKVFDGNGYSISGFNHSTPMFVGMNSGGVVKNLTLNAPSVSGIEYIGTIAGKVMAGALIDNCTVVGGTVTATSSNVGGIAGQSKGVISNCSFSGTVTSDNQNAGGIVGVTMSDIDNECSVKNCSVDATILAKNAAGGAGGIVGKCQTSTISDCSFDGTVSGTKNLGGIVGFAAATSGYKTTIINCVNSGSVNSNGGYAAGIAGNIVAGDEILGCQNSGDVTISLDAAKPSLVGYAGGIVGQAYAGAIVAGCVNSGKIGTADDDVDKITKIGCVVGTGAPAIVACYNVGTLSVADGSFTMGGIVGQLDAGGSIVACYGNDNIPVTSADKNYSPIGGYCQANSSTECYYLKTVDTIWKGNAKGVACEDIATLNSKVEAMNTAIASSVCTIYTFQAGTTELPTIIK